MTETAPTTSWRIATLFIPESALHSDSGQTHTDSDHAEYSPFLQNTDPKVHPTRLSPRHLEDEQEGHSLLSSYEPNMRTSTLESSGWF